MSYRYKFGPALSGNLARPSVAGELPDVEVDATITAVRANDPGKVDVDVAFDFPAYDPTAASGPDEVHAIFPPAGVTLTDPALAVASTYPRGSADASGHVAGGQLLVTVSGVPVPASPGLAAGLTVIGYPAPATTSPSTPAGGSTPPTSTAPAASSVPPADPSTPPAPAPAS